MRHDGYIENPFTGDYYQAACSCGWDGAKREDEEEAQADLTEHYKEEDYQPSGGLA